MVSGEVVTEDFLEDLKKLFMEITGMVIVGQRLGSLNQGLRLKFLTNFPQKSKTCYTKIIQKLICN
jgi:hypothetical protein